MRLQLVDLLDRKLTEALLAADRAILDQARAAWSGISPAPICPFVGDVMKAIHWTCHKGYLERTKLMRQVLVSTISPLKDALTPRTAQEIMAVVTKAFPQDQFVAVAQNTKGVYERAGAPPNKFDGSVFTFELSLITVSAANLSREAISSARLVLDELLLQRAMEKPPWWRRALIFIWTLAALPFVKWVFGILAAVITAALLLFLGIKG